MASLYQSLEEISLVITKVISIMATFLCGLAKLLKSITLQAGLVVVYSIIEELCQKM